MNSINELNKVKYEFDPLDIIECKLSVGLSGNESLIRLKKLDVLNVMISQDKEDFNTFSGNANTPAVRVVLDILRIRHIIWPSKLSYDTNGAPIWTTNDIDKTFRVHYVIADVGISGGIYREAYMNIDDLPSKIRSMKVDKVLSDNEGG